MESKFTIKEILEDHWTSFSQAYEGQIRSSVLSEVSKVLSCGETRNGFAMYVCPDCGKYRIVPFRCHSRFCNSCGVAYQRHRSESISAKLINCKHRHIVFTIAEELRIYFRKDRRLLNIHIPEKGFHMLRYYGLYSKGREAFPTLIRRLSSELLRSRKQLLRWRYLVDISFGRDPIACECGQTMQFSGIFDPRHRANPPPHMLQFV